MMVQNIMALIEGVGYSKECTPIPCDYLSTYEFKGKYFIE